MRKQEVLIIDDDSPIHKFISVVLHKYNVVVVSSDSIENAMIGFSHSNYKLIITDLFMTGVGGIEGISLMRKEKPRVPIIAISAGYKDMSEVVALSAARKIGANAVLAKPLTPESLIIAVDPYLS